MKTDNKVEEVINAMDQMHRAELSPFFTAKVINKIFDEDDYALISFKKIVFIVSFSILLLVINVVTFQKSKMSQFSINQSNELSTNELSIEYNLNSTTINYYNEKK